jgi:hypothetical protein
MLNEEHQIPCTGATSGAWTVYPSGIPDYNYN